MISVRIDIEKLEKMDKLIAFYNLNRSEFINRCIDYAMKNMPISVEKHSEEHKKENETTNNFKK